MQIRVLGCSGSIAAGSRTTSFLLDDDVLIDAGTGVGDLTLDELSRVDHILVTHSHLDHVLAIGLLADSVTRRRSATQQPPVRVHALAPTIAALRQHVFNNVIWPDFTRLPSVDHPVLAFVPIEVGQVLSLGDRREHQHRLVDAGQSGEVGPDHVVEDMLAQRRDGRRQRMHAHRRPLGGAAPARDAVGQQADGQHVVQVRVADEDVVDARHLVQRQVAHASAGVDQDVVIDEKGRGPAACGNGTRTTENANLHEGWRRHGVGIPRAKQRVPIVSRRAALRKSPKSQFPPLNGDMG